MRRPKDGETVKNVKHPKQRRQAGASKARPPAPQTNVGRRKPRVKSAAGPSTSITAAKTSGANAPYAQAKMAGPHVTLRVGNNVQQCLKPNELSVDVVAQLVAQIRQDAVKVVFGVEQLSAWPAEACDLLLNLIHQAGELATVRIGAKVFERPIDAVMAAIEGPADLHRHGRSIEAAKYAAALWYPQTPEAAAQQIAARVEEVGGPKLKGTTLTKEIRELSGKAQQGGKGAAHAGDAKNPTALAEAYLRERRETLHLEEAPVPISIFFKGEHFSWEGSHWRKLDGDTLRASITDLLQRCDLPKITRNLVSDVIENLRGLTHLTVDGDPPFWIESRPENRIAKRHLMILQNGMLDIDAIVADPTRPPQLLPHDARYFSTTAVTYSYDAGAKCPRFMQFINQVLPPKGPHDKRRYVMQEWFGYTLLGDCRFQKMLVITGDGNNGKSTAMDVWTAMLGANSVSHVEYSQIGGQFRLVDLRQKAANFSSEIDFLGKAREGLIKQLVDGVTMTADRKHLPSLTFTPHAKLIVACNELPVITDSTQGMWRRLIVMPFRETITHANETLAREICRTELPGVLNFAIRGLARLLRQHSFTLCEVCSTARDQHRVESDNVARFVSECCTLTGGWKAHCQRLYGLYRFFSTETGGTPPRPIVRDNVFGRRLSRPGIVRRRDSLNGRSWWYHGIKLSSAGYEWLDRFLNQQYHRPTWARVDEQIHADEYEVESGAPEVTP